MSLVSIVWCLNNSGKLTSISFKGGKTSISFLNKDAPNYLSLAASIWHIQNLQEKPREGDE